MSGSPSKVLGRLKKIGLKPVEQPPRFLAGKKLDAMWITGPNKMIWETLSKETPMELQKDLVKGGFHSTYSMCQQATASSASNSASDFDAKKSLGCAATRRAPSTRVDELHCLLKAILGQGKPLESRPCNL